MPKNFKGTVSCAAFGALLLLGAFSQTASAALSPTIETLDQWNWRDNHLKIREILDRVPQYGVSWRNGVEWYSSSPQGPSSFFCWRETAGAPLDAECSFTREADGSLAAFAYFMPDFFMGFKPEPPRSIWKRIFKKKPKREPITISLVVGLALRSDATADLDALVDRLQSQASQTGQKFGIYFTCNALPAPKWVTDVLETRGLAPDSERCHFLRDSASFYGSPGYGIVYYAK